MNICFKLLIITLSTVYCTRYAIQTFFCNLNYSIYRKWLNFTHFGTEGETIANLGTMNNIFSTTVFIIIQYIGQFKLFTLVMGVTTTVGS